MESIERTLQYRHSDPADPISAKGKFAFELDEYGKFTVCRSDYVADNVETRSESSSMEANCGSMLDVSSVAIDDLEDWTSRSTLWQERPLEPFKASEKSQLVGYVGNWSVVELPTFPWRLEAVNLEDIELEPYALYSKPASRAELIGHNLSSEVPQWNPKFNSRSVAEYSESVPPLTEDYSRDTDSIVISESLLGRDEILSHNLSYVAPYPEAKVKLSQQLPGIGAGFLSQFDNPPEIWPTLERETRTVTPDRPSTQSDGFDRGDCHMNEEQDILGGDDDSVFSDSESIDSDSIWGSYYSESVPVLEEGHPFLLLKPIVVREFLIAFQAWQQRPQDASENPSAVDSSGLPEKGKSSRSLRSKRDREDGNGSEESRENGDGQDGPRKRSRTSKKNSAHQVSFACPFAKKDPLKYRSCYTFVMKRIQDVKQHLSRCHQLPIYCPRCMTTVETELERDAHVRELTCPLQDAIAYEGVTRAQKAQLSQRVNSKMTLEDQWFTIFDILFPGHTPRPRSAYVNMELTIDLEAFQDLTYAEEPNIIAEAIRSRGIHLASMSNEERDLSTLLQSAIEEGLQIVAQRWSANNASSPAATRMALTDGSASSHIIEGSQPSLTSSDTLVDAVNVRNSAEQSQRVALGDLGDLGQDADDQEAQAYMQVPSTSQNMDVNEILPSYDGPPDALQATSIMSNLEPGYDETMSDLDMEYDEEFWKRFHQGGGFHTMNDYENPNAPSQEVTRPSGA